MILFMLYGQLKLLVEKHETSTVEFKKTTGQLHSAFETICAFLNGEGGTVLIGVTDKGQLIGQEVSDGTKQALANEIKKIEPPVHLKIDYVPLEKNKQVIVLHIHRGEHAPYIYEGRAFQRHQTTTVRMEQHRYEQLLVQRGQLNHSWEKLCATNYNIDRLDRAEILRTVKQGVEKNRLPAEALSEPIEDILLRLNVLSHDKLINAAAILFSSEVLPDYPQCLIKMGRFKGKDKLGEFIDNQQVYGNAFTLLSEADTFIRRHLPIASFFSPDDFERIDKPALPVLAVREALINAICHRDYSQSSAAISLAIYDDRMEIWNNGSLPKELRVEDLKRKHESYPRNKLISKVFYIRGFIERWGTGITKMIDGCKNSGLPEPQFEEYSGGLAVIFRFKESIVRIGESELPTDALLTQRQKQLLKILSNVPASIQIIIEQLSNPPSQRMIQKDLAHLRKLGLVETRGKGKALIWCLKR